MTDDLTRIALVGTAHAGGDLPPTGTPVDALVEALGTTERERALLLRAGALSIYREAGMVPERNDAPLPDPAPAETQPLCTPATAAIIAVLLRAHQDLLPEALDRMMALGVRLPPALLPDVLSARLSADLRPRLRHVLGKRGQWLARHNSAWGWAAEAPITADGLPPDAETLWNEGAPSQRSTVFARLRAVDPVRAREWLAATWRAEKADMRADLLAALAVNLSGEDEAFLEAALDDRVERVRAAAVAVLATLPHSAFIARMVARADALLVGYTPGALHITEHPTWGANFARDGLVHEPPRGTAKSDWWLEQILGYVPPEHWVARFEADPVALTTAAIGNPYEHALFVGWSRAAVLHGTGAWLAPLWDWWAHPHRARLTQHALRDALLAHMPAAEAEERLLRLMDAGHEVWGLVISSLPAPWSDAFGRAYLDRLERYVADLAPDAVSFDANWPQSFGPAGHSLSPALLAALPADLPTPWAHMATWQFHGWNNAWRDLREVAGLRLRLHTEIAAPGVG